MTVSNEHRLRVLAHLSAEAARIAPVAPVGSLFKQPALAKRRLSMGRKPRLVEPSHLDAVRALPCLKCGLEGFSEAAHLRLNCAALGKRTGIGEKPDDRWTVPLCANCHRIDPDSQHKIGEIAFWRAVGINPLRAAQALHRASPDLVAMRAAALRIIAERSA